LYIVNLGRLGAVIAAVLPLRLLIKDRQQFDILRRPGRGCAWRIDPANANGATS
jgi:hypothetical protein